MFIKYFVKVYNFLLLNFFFFKTRKQQEEKINSGPSNTTKAIEIFACAVCKMTFNTLEKCKIHTSEV